MASNHCSILVFAAVAALSAPVLAQPPDVGPGLQALRSGRFEEAERSFARLSHESPADPEGPFFQAFEMWWKLLDRSHDRPELRLRMEERLEEASERARVLQSAPDRDDQERGLVFFGVARLLDAQSKAMRGSHMGAAGSARQGHKALT